MQTRMWPMQNIGNFQIGVINADAERLNLPCIDHFYGEKFLRM